MEKSLNKSYHNLRRTNQDENGFNINKDAFSQNPDLRVERIFNTFNSALNEFYNKSIKTNDKLIDLGSGDENFIKFLKNKKIYAKGYDIDQVDLEISKIPESDSSIDFVTCISLIEHIEKPSNLLKEIFRILKPEGVLIIVTPNFNYCYKEFYDDPTHVNPFTPTKLYSYLKIFGFKNHHVLPWIVNKNPKIWRLKMKFFYARYCLIARGDSKLPIPKMLKGQSKSILSISKKID